MTGTSMGALAPTTVDFHGHPLTIINRDGQQWLSAADIARALGYAASDAVSRIYRRNVDEFTPGMSLTVNLTVNGINGSQREKEARIFTLRGAHLIAMFASTKVAKEFRRWVLDILDKEAAPPVAPAPTFDPTQALERFLSDGRYFVTFKNKTLSLRQIDDDAFVIPASRFAAAIAQPGSGFTTPQLIEIVHAAASKLKARGRV
ncbi:BRO-N domain-containing protein [Parapusillimonas sp. JC17]|uniref:BRO-N domain-containing protein n=1 Tax=Parapusillimonas sp. JC17 TaxID=3445768 RepID=UPI003FA0A339